MKKRKGLLTTTGSEDQQISPDASIARLRFRNLVGDEVNDKVPWIIEGLLAEGEQMLLCGAPKVGKSQFALQMAVAVSMGKPFHEWKMATSEPKRVFYVNLEIGERSFMRRLVEHVLAELGEERIPSSEEIVQKPLLKLVNEAIRENFYFSEEMRSIGITGNHIGGPQEAHNNQGAARESLLSEWHRTMDLIRPDLVIFDTLSKMHNLDERENNTIQGVLMLIRQMATTSIENDKEKRKELAHIVVHHSRKSSDDMRVSRKFSLDSIRGGSSIRAEADVIIGLVGKESPSKDSCPVPRSITIEARNIFGGDHEFEFNGCRFDARSPESEKRQADQYEAKVRDVFVARKVRGISTGELAGILAGNANDRSQGYKRESRRIKEFVENSNELDLIKKNENKDLIVKWRVSERIKHASEIYWIPDNSNWLKDKKFKSALQKTGEGFED